MRNVLNQFRREPENIENIARENRKISVDSYKNIERGMSLARLKILTRSTQSSL